MVERRSYARVKTDTKVTCRLSLESKTGGSENLSVTDISPAGLCFISQDKIQPGTKLKLALSLPFSCLPDPELYHLAKVAHCEQAGKTQKFQVGCYYIRPDKGGRHGR